MLLIFTITCYELSTEWLYLKLSFIIINIFLDMLFSLFHAYNSFTSVLKIVKTYHFHFRSDSTFFCLNLSTLLSTFAFLIHLEKRTFDWETLS